MNKERFDIINDRRLVFFYAYVGIAVLIFVIIQTTSLTMSKEFDWNFLFMLGVEMAFIFFWYLETDKYFIIQEDNEYDVKDHIKKAGLCHKGKIVHVSEKFDEENGLKKFNRMAVINFNDDRYIIYNMFPVDVETVEVSSEDLFENVLSQKQYEKDGIITLEEFNQEGAIQFNYEGSVFRNVKHDISCNVYEYKGRFLIDEIDDMYGFDANYKSYKENVRKYHLFSTYVLIVALIVIKLSSFLN
jgi:hypothetical protein